MQTKEERRNEILQRHIDEKRESGVPYTKEAVAEAVYSAMSEYAQPALDALREIIKMSKAGKILSHIDSSIVIVAKEALKQYNQ